MRVTWCPGMSWLTTPKPARTGYPWALKAVRLSLHCLVRFTARQCAVELNYAVIAGGSANGFCEWKLPVSTWVNTNMTEDWDKGIIKGHQVFLKCSAESLNQCFSPWTYLLLMQCLQR